MRIRKAMAVALAGALALTTIATGTTSEAAKKTKLTPGNRRVRKRRRNWERSMLLLRKKCL